MKYSVCRVLEIPMQVTAGSLSLSLSLCVCVCMCVCLCICVYVSMCVYVCMCGYVCGCVVVFDAVRESEANKSHSLVYPCTNISELYEDCVMLSVLPPPL